MPNRFIKESIRTSETLARISADAERLFWRLVVTVDDFGRFDARPNVLLGQCLSSFIGRVTPEQVERWLQELAEAGLVQVYAHDGKPYLVITTWDKHQQRRARSSKYPQPPTCDSTRDHLIADDSKRKHLHVLYVFENEKKDLAPSADADGAHETSFATGGAQSERAGKGEGLQGLLPVDVETPAPAEKPVSEYTPEFEEFWSAYPRKVEKKAAYKVWRTRIRAGAKAEDLILAAHNYAEECKRKGTEPEFIKHAKTFLGPSEPYVEYIHIRREKVDQAPPTKAQESEVDPLVAKGLRAAYAALGYDTN